MLPSISRRASRQLDGETRHGGPALSGRDVAQAGYTITREGTAMSDSAHAINRHYGQADLRAKILTALCAAGKDLEALTRDDLASFDELHDGGREGTRELARLAGLRAGMHVLDIGSGLEGPARTLAAE